MGKFLNPGNSSFARILKSYYIDKTGLISLINERIDTEDSLICISRPVVLESRMPHECYAPIMTILVILIACLTNMR